jgi:PST family polysaccharide transporter
MKSYIQKISTNMELQKVIKNIAWLLFDKGIKMGMGFFVGAWVVRYLGTERFGMMTYAISFTAIFGAAATLGMERIIIAELVRKPDKMNEILGSAFALRLIGSILAIILVVLSMGFLEGWGSVPLVFASISSFAFLFQSLEVIDQKFQAGLQAKLSVSAKNVAFLIVSAMRVYAILTQKDTIVFVWIAFLEIALSCLFLLVVYQWKKGNIIEWKPSKSISLHYLKESLPLLISYLSYLIYTRIDSVMLKNMLEDTNEVGLYGASLKLYDIPMSIFTMIALSFYPKLTEIYENKNQYFFDNVAQLTAMTTLISYAGLILCLLFGEWAIILVFGNAYAGTYLIFLCHLLGVVFVYNGAFRTTYLTLSNKNYLILANSIFSAVLNIILNYILIPIYKGVGAALATAITQFISFLIFNLFFKYTHILFWIQIKSLLLIPLWWKKK